jgi:Cu/Ag efflux protein CusF
MKMSGRSLGEKRLRAVFSAALLTALTGCAQTNSPATNVEPTPQAGQATESPIPWKTIEPPAQIGGAESQAKSPQPTAAKTYYGTGVVNLINLKEGWVEINHEEIKGLMPAMQMEWSVKDRALLNSIRVGDKVNFAVEDNHGSEVITELEKAPTTP